MGYELDKKLLKTLIDDVIYPVEDKLIKDMNLNEEDSIKLLKKVGFFKLSISPFKKDFSENGLRDDTRYMEKIYALPFEKAYVQELLGYYHDLYRKWSENHLGGKYEKNLLNFEEIMNNLSEVKSVDDNEKDLNTSFDEEFFDFDSDFDSVDKDGMHYKDEEKISASEFMESFGLDEDIIIDIKELLADYFSTSLSYTQIDEEFLENSSEVVRRFISVFELSVDFKDLSKSMEMLFDVLSSLKGIVNDLSEDNRTLLKLLIDAVMEDLDKWFKNVILEQSANDIHYLDASLLSSIEQISVIVQNIKDKEKLTEN